MIVREGQSRHAEGAQSTKAAKARLGPWLRGTLLAAGSVAITTSAMQVHFCFSCSRTSLSPLQPQNLAQACLPSPLASCLQLTLALPCSTLISAWRAISWPTPLHSYSGSQENETQRLLEPEQVEKRLSRVCLPLRKRATLAILLAPEQVERF